jgi:hypothetical protein
MKKWKPLTEALKGCVTNASKRRLNAQRMQLIKEAQKKKGR